MTFLLTFSYALMHAAYAGCETDMDCKGDRICNKGACTDPSSTNSQPPVPSIPKTLGITEAQRYELDRAKAKANIGYGGAVATTALGIGSLLLYDDDIASIMLGSGALLTAGITIPMASEGGANARGLARSAGVKVPSSSLAQTSWVGYSLGMLSGAILVGWGIADEAPPALILSTTVLGGVCAWSMGVDAETSAILVEEELKQSQARYEYTPYSPALVWYPSVGFTKDRAVFGVQGSF